MLLLVFLQRLFSLGSLAILGAAAWLLWRGYDAWHVADTLGFD